MSINIDLARKFFLEYLPPDAQVPVNDVFIQLKTQPLHVLNNGTIIGQMSYLKNVDPIPRVAFANGYLTGFAMAISMQYPEVEQMMQNYLENEARARGNNVIGFLAKKGK